MKSQLELVRLWRETSRHPGIDGTPAGAFWLRLNVCFFFLGKPRTKCSRFALARLIAKYGYYITGQSGIPVKQNFSTAGAGRPTLQQQSSRGCGLPGPYGGNVYGKARLPISVYRRMSPFASKKSPRLTAPVPSDDGSRKPPVPTYGKTHGKTHF